MVEQNSNSRGITSKPMILAFVLYPVPSTEPGKSSQRINTDWPKTGIVGRVSFRHVDQLMSSILMMQLYLCKMYVIRLPGENKVFILYLRTRKCGLVLITNHLHGLLFSSTSLTWALGPETWVQILALSSSVTLGKII